MKIFKFPAAALGAAFALAMSLFVAATPAQAQATRTWVSGVGDDVNPCSRTAPCKTFAGAISKTAAGGEINCLDPGGYGTVTITKSITIDCTGTLGSILNSGGINGVNINDSATGTPNTIDVILKGLTIDGAGTTAGLNGIRFTSGRSLMVEDVLIQNQNGNSGISLAPGGAIRVNLNRVTVTDSLNGIAVQPTGAGGSVRLTLNHVSLLNYTTTGLSLNTTGNTSVPGISAVARNSTFAGGSNGILLTTVVGSGPAVIMLVDATVFNNSLLGIRADGGSARARVGNSIITANGTGVSIANSGAIFTYGNNKLDLNSTDGTFAAPVIAEE
jgi:hypothetical protein